MQQQLMQMMGQGQQRGQEQQPQGMDIEQILQMLLQSGADEGEVMQLLQMLGG
jgi:hypothetical protein